MANEKFTDLPTVVSAALSDIICTVQGGVSVQETLGQILTLMQGNIVQNFAGNPNGSVAGTVYGLCWDKTNNILYVCTTSGNAATAVWTRAGSVPTPSNSSVLASTALGAMTWLGPLTNGQVIIGSTGATPVAATLTAGAGILISNSAGAITISGTGGGYGWTEVTGVSQSMAVNNGYIANNAGLVTLTLPATAAVGDTVILQGKGTGLYSIAQNAGQTIHFGSSNTTTGAGGSLTATNRYDSIELLCITANTDWAVLTGAQGTFTVV